MEEISKHLNEYLIMDYISDLQTIVSDWLNRMSDVTQPIAYRDALNECIYDLNKVIDNMIKKQTDYQRILAEHEADNYLMGMEAYEEAV